MGRYIALYYSVIPLEYASISPLLPLITVRASSYERQVTRISIKSWEKCNEQDSQLLVANHNNSQEAEHKTSV